MESKGKLTPQRETSCAASRVAAQTAFAAILIGCAAWPAPQAHGEESDEPARAAAQTAGEREFASSVAPVLTRHCSEGHGTASKKGRFDLSHKEAAFAGGDSGPPIVPGKASESLLWELVEADEMPENRPPLSPREKQTLRQWIEDGAPWPAGAVVGESPDDALLASNWLRRLTVPEYIQTVAQAVGVDVSAEARRILPRDLRADGFSNTAYSLGVDLEHVEAYAELAELIVGRMDVAAFAAEHAPCQELSEACMPETIASIGKWLLRGPLEEHELRAFEQIATAVADEGGDYNEAVAYVVEAMLQSPRFLYRIEAQRGGGERRFASYELASRLSYILWGGPPDKELMRAADVGELTYREGVERQVLRMLDDARTKKRSAQFISEWLNLEQLDYLRPSHERFPRWNAALAADMRLETLAYFDEVVWKQERPLWDLMNAQVAFLTPRLASHYGLDPRDGIAAAALASPAIPASGTPDSQAWQGERFTAGPADLQALYTFDAGSGSVIRDRSGRDQPLDLSIDDPEGVTWGPDGLAVHRSIRITSDGPAKRLIAAIRDANAVTLEAWITPADDTQSGPARLITLSSGISERNFTLGQDGNKWEVRFRATRTDANGLPGLATPAGKAGPAPTHVTYTRDAGGRARLYIDGVETGNEDIGGNLSTWDASFSLGLANESTGERPWLGTLHRIAIYSRALSPQEVLSASRVNTPLLRYDVAEVPARGGLLTQGSTLTIGGDDASMVTRGLFVLKDLLYSRVGNPPPCLDTTPVPTKPGLSQREIAMGRVNSAACGGCHSKFEPLAFGLEKFDGLGSFQEMDEHGNKLREDGEIIIPGEDAPLAYETSAELMDLLAGSARVRMNITRKLTQFAIGRPVVEADTTTLEEIHRSATAGGGTYASLMKAIVMSDLVQTTSTETE